MVAVTLFELVDLIAVLENLGLDPEVCLKVDCFDLYLLLSKSTLLVQSTQMLWRCLQHSLISQVGNVPLKLCLKIDKVVH